jgi:hypothetical protein
MLFDAVAGDDIASRLTDQSRFWTFTVFETNYGHFRAVGYSPLTAPGSAANDGGAIPANLFELEDGARIAVGGEPTTAGQLKNALRAQMLEESGAPQPVQARRSDDTAIAGTTNAATVTRHTAPATVSQSAIQHTETATVRQAGSTLSPATPIAAVASGGRLSSPALGVDCSGQAPRVLQVLDGPRAGEPFAIEGTCLGSSHGTIQLIGLPTGPLNVAFTSWTDNSIAALMPSVSGVQDQRLSLTVIRNPDRRTSPPREVRFEAARETVRVPAERWTPLTRVHKAVVFQGETPMPVQTAEPGASQSGLRARYGGRQSETRIDRVHSWLGRRASGSCIRRHGLETLLRSHAQRRSASVDPLGPRLRSRLRRRSNRVLPHRRQTMN